MSRPEHEREESKSQNWTASFSLRGLRTVILLFGGLFGFMWQLIIGPSDPYLIAASLIMMGLEGALRGDKK